MHLGNLIEWWIHQADSDSSSIHWLWAEGFHVVNCPRPWSPSIVSSLLRNHGGIAAVAVAAVKLSNLDGVKAERFEFACIWACILSCHHALYWYYITLDQTGPVKLKFFVQLSDILGIVVTYNDSIFVVGYINKHLNCVDDAYCSQSLDVLMSSGLHCLVNAPTYVLDNTLDVVITWYDAPSFAVGCFDDQFL